MLRLINSMVTELIRPVNYNPGISQKLIKLEISSCRCSELECKEECDEIEGYSALYTPLLSLMQAKSIAECSKGSILQYFQPSLSYHLPLKALFCLFLSGRLRQVLLYMYCNGDVVESSSVNGILSCILLMGDVLTVQIQIRFGSWSSLFAKKT